MTTAAETPVVGKSFYAMCKKCATDRYHTVLALPTETSAKLECEVCKAKSTWKAPKAAKAKTAKVSRPRVDKAAAAASAHAAEYEKLMSEAEGSAGKYSMKSKFEKDFKLEHPTFGTGVIRTVQPDKIEVVFQDQVRNLVHNRT